MAFRFRKFEVYNDIKLLVRFVFQLTRKFPRDLKYSLVDDINRAAISVLLNFAEGSDRGSDREFKHFVDISIGSLNEVVGGFDIAQDENIISRKEFEEIINKAEIIVRKLGALKKRLKGS